MSKFNVGDKVTHPIHGLGTVSSVTYPNSERCRVDWGDGTWDWHNSSQLKLKTKIIFEQSYHGFESLSDVFRDVQEAFDTDFNPEMAGIPSEFQGTMKVTITYEGQENE